MSNIFALLEKKKQELEAQSGRRGRTEKLPAGKSRWRILPGWRGGDDAEFSATFGQHFVKVPGSDKPVAIYVCTDVSLGKPCDVCQAIEQGILQTTDDKVINALKESKSSRRILVNALRRDGAEPNKVVILELAPTAFEQFLDGARQYAQESINVLDLAAGHDVAFDKSGTGMNTKYTTVMVPKATTIDKSVLSNLVNLDEYVRQEYEQGLKKALTAVAQATGKTLALADSSAFGGPGMASKALPAAPAAHIATGAVIDKTGTPVAPVVASVSSAPVATPPPAAAPATPGVSAAVSGDDDLDALFASLEAGAKA